MFFDKTAQPLRPVNVVDGYVEATIHYSTDSIIPTPYVTKNGTSVKAMIPALAHIGDGLGMFRVLRATQALRLKGLNKILTIVDEEVDTFAVRATPGTALSETQK
jgi:hypothetical protein